jgi:hypothetical protein
MNEAIVERLAAQRNEDGGWGSTAGRPSGTEYTALACMAMSVVARTAESNAALDWLVRAQRPDGAWPVSVDIPEPAWCTSLAVLALLDSVGGDPSARRGIDWLLAEKGIGVSLRVRISEFFRDRKTTALDPTLRGWPWVQGTFSWIEPTAWAILALLRAWPDGLPRHARERADEGREMILDRTCPGGGWNYGNKIVLGVDMEPYPDSTAAALLALGALREDADEVELSFAALDRLLAITHSGLTLSLSILCYREWGRDTAALDGLLDAAFERTGFLDDTRSLALATLALADGPSPLLVNGD